jgi:anti-anti-sigma factor
MRITHRTHRDATILELADEFTFSKRKEFTAAMERAKQSGSRRIILNLTNVTFLDSAALGLLALSGQQLAADHRELCLVGPQGTVKQLLDITQITQVLPVFPSEEAAVGGKAA